ncbi:molybdopterin adenylyltransferase [Flavobacterium pectinovorum]|uniref:molybdopterin adenylyltransferase n=1 Tax=Flavobacterium pectinovorum TaxID=29533 RepID=UPI00265F46A0|nr:molybdopterin adenylyltransferase [Flavobacterium pectinovorum]WKL47838.1 molybdopterin adenylyltransferase [Flavobacterium pectinovorum]WKL48945.1 molybdopterin adenylyltransferase [Flavobacterium pectinovorum]
MGNLKIGILTISDRASQGLYQDFSGQEIRRVVDNYTSDSCDFAYCIIPDEEELIYDKLVYLSDTEKCCLILTTGGTGPALRDVTPEATERACQKMLPGFGELMRKESLAHVPTAILSRQTAGIRNQTLIVNLPGKPSAIETCLKAVFPAIPYCIDLLEGPFMTCNPAEIRIFRPKK